MQNINIGKSGIQVPFLGMGTWAIGGGAWWGDNDDALSVKAIQTAVEQGIQWIDTAPIYGLYHSEEVVGEAMKHIDRDKVVLSTKCGLEWRHETPVLHKVVDGTTVYRDLSAKSIIEDVEDSLRRLHTDHLDVLYTHWQTPDFGIYPLEETVEAMMTPYDISKFELMNSSIMAYPQPIYIKGKGHFLFFTRYDGRRQLFFQTSPDGKTWSDYQQIASIMDEGEKQSGHYSTTGNWNNKLAIAFNRHPDGRVDYRTNMYYLQTEDFGKTWTTVDGKTVKLPVTERLNPSLVLEVESEGKNLYVKDIEFTPEGYPVILYLTSEGWEAGPINGMRHWYTCYWNGKTWIKKMITTSTHNYDSGSLWIDGETWTVIAPTDAGPQKWGTGGEIVSWESKDRGNTWTRKITYTKDSPRNHGYVRKPLNATNPFYCMWGDGHSDIFSISKLYFGDSEGNVYMMPYIMQDDWEKPLKIGTQEVILYDANVVVDEIRNNMINVDLHEKRVLISKYEVTQKQWYSVMGYNPSHFQGELLPVTNVS